MSADKQRHLTVDYLCWNSECLGGGRWSVLVDTDGDPLDEYDADCPSCGVEGTPEEGR